MFNTPQKLIGMTALIVASATSPLQAQTTDRVECTLATHNNNTPGSKQLDDGKSFWFSWECKTDNWRVWALGYGYTRNSGFNEKTGITVGDRIDHAQISVLHKIWEFHNDLGQLEIFTGVWIQWTGNFGGANQQNTWHDEWPSALTKNQYNQRYSYQNTYETDRHVRSISGSTPDIRIHIEGNSKPLYGDEQYGISGYGTMDLQIPLNRKYDETALQVTTGVKVNIDRVTINLWGTTHLYRELPRSDVIQAAGNNPRNYLSVRVSGILWKWKGDDGITIVPYIQIQWTKQDNLQGTAWIKMTF